MRECTRRQARNMSRRRKGRIGFAAAVLAASLLSLTNAAHAEAAEWCAPMPASTVTDGSRLHIETVGAGPFRNGTPIAFHIDYRRLPRHAVLAVELDPVRSADAKGCMILDRRFGGSLEIEPRAAAGSGTLLWIWPGQHIFDAPTDTAEAHGPVLPGRYTVSVLAFRHTGCMVGMCAYPPPYLFQAISAPFDIVD